MSMVDSALAPERALLLAAGLDKRFGARAAVTGLTLSAHPGELIALAGSNGCGKSTALRLLAGLLPADAGHCTVLGRDVGRLDRATRNAIGFLPQRQALYASLSVYENLRFRAAVAGMRKPADHAQNSLRELGLSQRGHEPLGTFSGGWIRRIEMAATLMHAPKLLLLDEPTTGVDALSRQRIWQQLDERLANGAAVVFSSHEPMELQRAARCITLAQSDDAR